MNRLSQNSNSATPQLLSIVTPEITFDCADGQALEFVHLDEHTGKIKVNYETMMTIQKYSGNVAFCSVIGKQFTGKTFLLNKIQDLKNEAFRLKKSIDQENYDLSIYIWSKPVYNEQENSHIFFQDTCGVSNDTNENTNHQRKFLAQVFIISSFMIKNISGKIDESVIDQLSLFRSLSDNIVISDDEDSIDYTLSFYAPSILLALRDSEYNFKDPNGKIITNKRYMESALTEIEDIRKVSEENVRNRESFITIFKSRDCIGFKNPFITEDASTERTNRQGQLCMSFKNTINQIRDKIYRNCICKQFRGVNFTSTMFMHMIKNYINNLNEDKPINLYSAWESTLVNECDIALLKAKETYDTKYADSFSHQKTFFSFLDLKKQLSSIKDKAYSTFNQVFYIRDKNVELYLKYNESLSKYIDQKELEIIKFNEEFCTKYNDEVLTNDKQNIEKSLRKGQYHDSNKESLIKAYDDLFSNFHNISGQTKNDCKVFFKNLKELQTNTFINLKSSINFRMQEGAHRKTIELDLEKEEESKLSKQLSHVKNQYDEQELINNYENQNIQKKREEKESSLDQLRQKEADLKSLKELGVELAEKKVKLFNELHQQQKNKKEFTKKKKTSCVCNG